jgi:hypothetical protein
LNEASPDLCLTVRRSFAPLSDSRNRTLIVSVGGDICVDVWMCGCVLRQSRRFHIIIIKDRKRQRRKRLDRWPSWTGPERSRIGVSEHNDDMSGSSRSNSTVDIRRDAKHRIQESQANTTQVRMEGGGRTVETVNTSDSTSLGQIARQRETDTQPHCPRARPSSR